MISTLDRQTLREAAKRVAAIAVLPVMELRRAMWRRHNSLKRERPLVLIFPEGAWDELLPDGTLKVQDPELRHWEWMLRSTIHEHEHFPNDKPIERTWPVYKAVRNSGWGLSPRDTASSQASKGARHYEQVLRSPEDLKQIRMPELSVDEAETRRRHELAQDLLGDILDVQLHGVPSISFHPMGDYMRLRGHEQSLLDMYMEPQLVHDTMALFEQGHRGIVRQYEELGLLTLNNNGAYHSSGGLGYIDALPAPGFDGTHVRPRDIWASAESQELAAVSPEQHEEFALQYERRLLEPFGLNGYGCCEPLHDKLDYVLTIPNIRRVSISPWADVEKSAQKLGARAIFSWKPHPAHLVGDFSEQRIREYIRHALDATAGCVVEMILKDTHTCENRPERFAQWAKIAMDLAQQY
jgi:hypothetical protein